MKELNENRLLATMGTLTDAEPNITLQHGYKQSLAGKDKPFEDVSENPKIVPNAETKAALNEYDEMRNNPDKYKRYHNFSEALKDIDDKT